jgi:hypothetical protein
MSKDFDYEEFVIECYNDKKDQEIHNASEENALLLFNKLFRKALLPTTIKLGNSSKFEAIFKLPLDCW